MSEARSKFRFQRSSNAAIAFGRTNRASTDALGALHRWRDVREGRNFEILVDEDNHLDAELTCDQADPDAGPQLDGLCFQHGVERSSLP